MSLSEISPPQRRRGATLEDALLDAAWAELTEHGYDAMTIEAVAARAGTSRPVIYRRWKGKAELVRAAIGYGSGRDPITVPDTGTLRGDLIQVLDSANTARVAFASMVITRLGGFFEETGGSLSDLRETVLAGRPSAMDTIMERAIERGEVDPAKLTPRIIRLPIDLWRLEFLMTSQPVPREVTEEIVDTMFLPLVRPS